VRHRRYFGARPYVPPGGDSPDPLTVRRIELAADWQEQERARLAAPAEERPEAPGPVPLTVPGILLVVAVVALVLTLFVIGVL
jgi:hypothetical protein